MLRRMKYVNVIYSILFIVIFALGQVFVLRRRSELDRSLSLAVLNADIQRTHRLLEEGADGNTRYLPSMSLWNWMLDQLGQVRRQPLSGYRPTILITLMEPRLTNHVLISPPVDDYTKIIFDLIDHGADINATDYSKRSALGLATMAQSHKVVRILLDRHADPNQEDSLGMTPIFYSSPQTSELLLKYGADVNVRDKRGRTALMNAVLSLNSDQVKWLISHGADTAIRDNVGRSALDWARKMKQLVRNTPDGVNTANSVLYTLDKANAQ